MNKIITYQKTETFNTPKFFNEQLEKIDGTIKTVTFIQTDLIKNIKNLNEFINNYLNLMQQLNLPFTFFPYYGTFNRVMTDTLNFINPKLLINANDKKYHINVQPIFGLLIIDVQKIKNNNIKFDETLPEIFYLQDFVEQCFQKKLWISNCAFVDIINSNEYLINEKEKTYNINVEQFKKQQETYNKKQPKYAPLQQFVDKFKQYLIDKNIITAKVDE